MQTYARELEAPSAHQVGYFCHLGLDGRHLGGILVTNEIGVPLEFKYTEPVTISRLQKTLYGVVLDRYLHETLIRDSLARELHSIPKYFIAGFEEKEYLGTLAGREMIALQEIRSPAPDPGASFNRTRDREAVVLAEDGLGLRVAFSTSNDAIQQDMIAWLQSIAQNMEILEPLERIKTALKMLISEERRR